MFLSLQGLKQVLFLNLSYPEYRKSVVVSLYFRFNMNTLQKIDRKIRIAAYHFTKVFNFTFKNKILKTISTIRVQSQLLVLVVCKLNQSNLKFQNTVRQLTPENRIIFIIYIFQICKFLINKILQDFASLFCCYTAYKQILDV